MKHKCEKMLVLFAALCFLGGGRALGNFVLIDDFESYTEGGIDGQRTDTGVWIADPEYEVVVEPGTNDKVLNIPSTPDNLNASNNYSNLEIDEGALGTLFYRFQRAGEGSHIVYGLSPLDDPREWGDFESSISARTQNEPGRLQVRSSNAYITVKDFFELDEWISVWMVIDNDLDEFQVYAQSEITFPEQELLESGGTDLFLFRNGTDDPLTSFFVRTGLQHEGPYYIDDIFLDPTGENLEVPTGNEAPSLQAGDADQDLDFDQLDLVMVQIAAKYLTGQPAIWGEGDWDGAPGGEPGSPPAGNGLFDQLDIISALAPGHYLTGPYAALTPNGARDDGQTSIVYGLATGELAVDAPQNTELTSINIDSAADIFTGDPAANLGGSFDNATNDNIFKATFGSSFGSLSFGNVAQEGLSEDFVANDLTVVGSLAGGGDLGPVDLVFVPEPSTMVLLGLGILGAMVLGRRQ